MKKSIYIGLILLLSGHVFAQQDPIFSQYMYNGLVINPAYAGSNEVLTLNATARKQWVGVPGSPLTFMGSGHSPLFRKNIGVGAIFMNDQAGFVTQNSFVLAGSYKIKFPDASLSFGLQGGFTNYRIDFSKITTKDAMDDKFPSNDFSSFVPNFGFGMYYLRKNMALGLSVPYLMDQILNNNFNTSVALQRRYYMLYAAYLFNLSPALKLKPSLLYKLAPGIPMQIDLNANLIIHKVLWLGVSYRSLSSINLMTQFDLTEQLTLGYSFDISTLGLKNNASSHEILIQYRFNFFKDNTISPRYF